MKVNLSVFVKVRNSRITRLIKGVSEKYKVYRALRDVKGPHISFIYLEEKIPEKDAKRIIQYYRKKVRKIGSFVIKVDGIKSFKKNKNYTIYAKVVPNKSLTELYRIFNYGIKGYEYRKYKGFYPHISIARSDVSKGQFYAILKKYKETKLKFQKKLTYVYAGIRKRKHGEWELHKLSLK